MGASWKEFSAEVWIGKKEKGKQSQAREDEADDDGGGNVVEAHGGEEPEEFDGPCEKAIREEIKIPHDGEHGDPAEDEADFQHVPVQDAIQQGEVHERQEHVPDDDVDLVVGEAGGRGDGLEELDGEGEEEIHGWPRHVFLTKSSLA